MSVEPRPITHCPLCHYDLAGLPGNYRCPECGFEYDEVTIVWRPAAIPRFLLLIGWIVLFEIATQAVYPTRWLMRGLGLDRDAALAIVVCISAVPSFAGLFYPRGLIVVSQRGVTFRGLMGVARFVAWRQMLVGANCLLPSVVEGREEFDLVLPSTGLTTRWQRLLHAVIAERWQAARAASFKEEEREADLPKDDSAG